jgi:hypothetical protein
LEIAIIQNSFNKEFMTDFFLFLFGCVPEKIAVFMKNGEMANLKGRVIVSVGDEKKNVSEFQGFK